MKTQWYKNAVVYQIYPFSFKDANNDGWGDIEGIISKLDYIKDLGVTAIWFSPLYKSPDFDYGYDVSDYTDIDEKFGTMADFDRLLKECHKRGMKVIMDMVLNHTSIEHPWFRKAVEEKDPEYKEYYIIRKGIERNGRLYPPTNWASTFTGSAWEWISGTDEYYLHLFCREQADLNWENPKVREEIIKILNFWLDKGVDGFRYDVFNMFSKVYPLKDDYSKSFQKGSPYFVDGPRMHEFLKELNEKSLSHYDSFTVGESYHPSKQNALEYVKEENKELDSIFNFAHLDSDNIGGAKFFYKPFDLKQFKKGLFDPQRNNYGKGWNTLVLENHDNPRSVSRFGIDYRHYRYEAATMLAGITYLGYGTPFIYQGQEIGMYNCDFKSIDQMKDPVSHFVYDLMTGYGMPRSLAFRFIRYGARDHARIPMKWDDTINAGFNAGHKPWQWDDKDSSVNVKADVSSDKSVYRFYQDLLKIRKKDAAFIYGKTIEHDHDSKRIIAYERVYEGRRFFVLGNFSKKKTSYTLPDFVKEDELLINNYEDFEKKDGKIVLQPYQVLAFGRPQEESHRRVLKRVRRVN